MDPQTFPKPQTLWTANRGTPTRGRLVDLALLQALQHQFLQDFGFVSERPCTGLQQGVGFMVRAKQKGLT